MRTPEAVAQADVVVALTSWNDVGTIGTVARAVREGADRAVGAGRVCFVLADAGSTDGSRELAREALGHDACVDVSCAPGPPLAEPLYHGHPNRPGVVRGAMEAAQRLGARACAVLDASLDTVEPEWIERLVGPVLHDGFDYVSPHYHRRVGEGALTRGLVYPLFRALYGVRLHQPAGSEFGCSPRLIAQCLEQDFWEAERAGPGVDLWISSAAACGDLRLCEASLGVRHAACRGMVPDLGSQIAQVAGALFDDLSHRAGDWQRVRGSTAVPLFGAPGDARQAQTPPDADGLLAAFRLGQQELRDVWMFALAPKTLVEIRKLSGLPTGQFRFDDRLWATIVYDFAVGHHLRVIAPEHLLRSLTPLFSGWLASFVLEMGDADAAALDARVEQLCEAFESEKRHLIARWRWPERLR